MNVRSLANPAFFVVLGVLALSAIGMNSAINAYGLYLSKRPVPPPDNRQLSSIPPETESWVRRGPDRTESAEVVEVLGTDNYVTRTMFRREREDEGDGEGGDGRPMAIEFHAAYYTGMIDTVPHVPERCFVGGGLQIGSASRTVPLPLDISRLRDETEDPFLRGQTPEEFMPVRLADPSAPDGERRTAYWVRLSNRHSNKPGELVRLSFDPRDLRLRVTEFRGPDDQAFYSGYFFLANGGVVASAEGVRLLAFDLRDDYAFYLKVQFTSWSVNSPEELAEEAGALLDEMLGEILLCVPDWIEVQRGNYPEDNPRRAGGAA